MMGIYNIIFIIFSILQTATNLNIYSGLWHVVYLWIGIASVLFVLVYNLHNDKTIETGIVLFIIHSFKIFDREPIFWDFGLVHGLVYLIALYLLIGIHNKRYLPPRKNLFNLSILLFACLALVSTVYSVCFYNALQQYLLLLDFLTVTFIIANYFKEERQINFLLNVFFVIGLALVSLAVLKLTNVNFYKLLSNRVKIEGVHPNSIAGYLNVLILLIIPVCLKVKKTGARILFILFTINCLIFSIITFSRLGIFSLVFCLLLFIAIAYKKINTYLNETRFVITLILVSFAILLIPQVNFGLITRILNAGSNSANFYNCLVTLESIKNNPLIGIGFNNHYFLANYGDIPFLNSRWYNLGLNNTQVLLRCPPHSLFLGIACYLGIAGLASFIIIILITLKSAWNIINQKEDSYWSRVALGCFLALVSMLIHGILAMTFHFTIWPSIFWVLIGIIMAARNRDAESRLFAVSKPFLKIMIVFVLLLQILIVVLPVFSEQFYRSGINYLNRGEVDKGIKEIKKAMLVNSFNPEYLLCLRDIYDKKDMKKEAIEISMKLISLKRYYAPYYVKLGDLYSDLGMNALAMQEFQKAVELDRLGSQEGEHYSKLIALYIRLGMIKEANDLYKEAIRLIPSLKHAEFVKKLEI